MELFKLLGTIAINGIEEANKKIDDFSTKAKEAGEKLKSAGDKVSGIGKNLMPVTTALGGIAVASGKMAMDFEDAIAKVSTIADTTQVPIEQLETAIIKLSNETGVSSAEIAENVYNAISAGQKTGDAVAFVEKATMLAKAGFAESGDALDILTTIMNSYGLEASEVDKVSNNLIMTQNLGKTTVAELSAAMGKAIPTAKSVGVNLDQLCGSYAIMTANGIATAETTTYLNSMLNELGKQGTSAEIAFRKGTEHIKAGGLSMKEAMEMGWGLTDVLSILDEEAVASGTSINNLFGSAEAGKAAAVLMDNASGLNAAVEEMGKSAGATEEAFKKLETNSFSIQKALNSLKNTGIELGNTIMGMLAPYIEIVAEKVGQLNDWFTSLDDTQKKHIVQIGLVVAAIGPLLMIIGKVISVIGTISTVVGTLIPALGSLSAVIGALTSPAFLVVGAITSIAAAFIYLWNTSEEFQNAVKNGFQLLWGAVQTLWDSIGKPVFDTIMSMIETTKTWFTSNFGEIDTIVKTVFQDIQALWTGHLQPCLQAIGNFLTNWVLPVFQRVFEGFILPIVEQVFRRIGDYWNNVLKPIFTGIIDFITGVFSGNWRKAFEGIISIAQGILNGIVRVFEAPFERAKNIVNNAINFIRSLFNFQWSLPPLKLPHFRISGSFSLNPPSVPTFGIDWYKKAMDDPMIMNSPTAFGINAKGQIMAGGEAGSEVVSGTETLMRMISEAVSANNSRLEEALDALLSMLSQYLPQLSNMQIVMDGDAVVGRLAPKMDVALGTRQAMASRGL